MRRFDLPLIYTDSWRSQRRKVWLLLSVHIDQCIASGLGLLVRDSGVSLPDQLANADLT